MSMTGYEQQIYHKVLDKLREKNFERLDIYKWAYTFPDGKRTILVEFENSMLAKVTFEEGHIFQSPFALMEGLDIFNK